MTVTASSANFRYLACSWKSSLVSRNLAIKKYRLIGYNDSLNHKNVESFDDRLGRDQLGNLPNCRKNSGQGRFNYPERASLAMVLFVSERHQLGSRFVNI